MIFLYSTISSIFGMVAIISTSFSSPCPCWTFRIGSWMLWDWLAVALLCTVLLLLLRFVSVVVLWFALPAFGSALLLSTVGSALLSAVAFALLGSFRHRSRSLCSSRCPRTLVALLRSSHHLLLAVVPSVLLSHHWLFGCGSVCASFSKSLCGMLRLRGSFLASPNTTTTQHCALHALDPREGSIQRRVLLL